MDNKKMDDTTNNSIISRNSSSSSISSTRTTTTTPTTTTVMQPIMYQQQQQPNQQQLQKQQTRDEVFGKDIISTTKTTIVVSKSLEQNSDDVIVVSSSSSSSSSTTWFRSKVLPIVLSLFVWPGMIVVPLLLSSPYSFTSYKILFPSEWYEVINDGNNNNTNVNNTSSNKYPKVLGLLLGIIAVTIGQFLTCIFFYCLRKYTNPLPVQSKGVTSYRFLDGLKVHLAQPEGFGLLGLYLSVTWMFNLMPLNYYNFHGTIQYEYVLGCLLIQDCIQFIMHRMEHVISAEFYKISHKPHHKFINPILFDAFNGSITDTICMVVIPLYITANIMRYCNVWTYMAFGSIYANWLTLIHSEYVLPWDTYIFHPIKFGTAADHHVHHKFFIFNYGHLFMYWDIIFGTYRSPESFGPKAFTLPSSSSTSTSSTTTTTTTSTKATIAATQ